MAFPEGEQFIVEPGTARPVSGEDLRLLRENHGFTPAGLAEAAGLDVEQVRAWEGAKVLPPGLDIAIARVIDGEVSG